ncbi:hypothetical protein [Pseudomonas phage BUCT640]|nr:hypothetical protein [Pseudomonas phage BUCT640]
MKTVLTADKILGKDQITAGLVALKSFNKAWNEATQQLAASATVLAHEHGDVRAIRAMLAMMPKGAKTNSLRRYFERYAPVKWSELKKEFKFDGNKQHKGVRQGETEEDLALFSGILNTHWSDCGPAETADNFKPIDLQARLLRLVKDCNKELEGEFKDQAKVTADQVNQLNTLLRQMFPNGEAA